MANYNSIDYILASMKLENSEEHYITTNAVLKRTLDGPSCIYYHINSVALKPLQLKAIYNTNLELQVVTRTLTRVSTST